MEFLRTVNASIVALALGGFFLLRYSIEQGWFGPTMRTVLGALLTLLAALELWQDWGRTDRDMARHGS